jgi:hypothetical protein
MSRTLSDLDDVFELTNYVLESSEEVVKRAKVIKDQLIDSQNFIRDCGGKEKKVTRRLEKLLSSGQSSCTSILVPLL